MREKAKDKTAKDFPQFSLPPQSPEAEGSVIGRILQENKKFLTAWQILEAEDFYKPAHQKIFAAMIDLTNEETPIDLLTLTNQLKKKGELESVGGASYLVILHDGTPATENVAHHAKIIKGDAVKRVVLEKTNELARTAFTPGVRVDELVAKVIEMPSEIMKKAAKGSGANKLELSTEELFDYFSFSKETPFESLNRAIGGFMPYELTIVGGRTGMGKTALVLEFLSHTAIDEGSPVVYCGAQMVMPIIYRRLDAQRCKIPLNKIGGGRITEKDELEMMDRCHQQINDAPIHSIVIKQRIAVPALQIEIINALEKIDKLNQGPGLLIIENLQELFWPGKEFKHPLEQADFIIEKIKPFCYQIKIPVIISSQLNRKLEDREDKRPKTSDLFSKAAEELSNKILLLYRPNAYEPKKIEEEGKPERDAEIIVGKGGTPGNIPLTFWGEYLSWEEGETE